MAEQVLDTLILSDVHLGSEVSRAREAAELIAGRTNFRRLVLLGDIFSDLNFRRLTSDHWKFLSRIRKLSNPKRQVEVVWVEGNHDQGLSQIMSHLVGVPVYQRYVWEYQGKRHLAVHGHQFHPFCRKNEFLSRIGERIFYELQKMEGNRKRISRFIDRINTRWLRMESIVAEGRIPLRPRRTSGPHLLRTYPRRHPPEPSRDRLLQQRKLDRRQPDLSHHRRGGGCRFASTKGTSTITRKRSKSEAELIAAWTIRSDAACGLRELRERALLRSAEKDT